MTSFSSEYKTNIRVGHLKNTKGSWDTAMKFRPQLILSSLMEWAFLLSSGVQIFCANSDFLYLNYTYFYY